MEDMEGREMRQFEDKLCDLGITKWSIPKISIKEKVVLLPDMITDKDNYAMMAIVNLGSVLGFTPRVIPYGERRQRELTKSAEHFSIGILCGVDDWLVMVEPAVTSLSLQLYCAGPNA